jgi:hypothetical protein
MWSLWKLLAVSDLPLFEIVRKGKGVLWKIGRVVRVRDLIWLDTPFVLENGFLDEKPEDTPYRKAPTEDT